MQNIQRNYKKKAEEAPDQISRKLDVLFKFKSFNNWLKNVLLTQKAHQLKMTLKNQLDLSKAEFMLHVLDIGCGKGGDMKKLKSAGVGLVVGVDFSQACLTEYKKRYNKERDIFKLHLQQKDCGVQPQQFMKGFKNVKFDMVSSQFSMHYMFKNRISAQNLVRNMTANLMKGGYVVMTLPDAYSITKKVFVQKNRQPDGSFLYDNTNCAIRFKEQKQRLDIFGLQYQFYLKGSLGERDKQGIQFVTEWLVDLDYLQLMFKQNGCRVEESLNFVEFYSKYKSAHAKSLEFFGLKFKEGEELSEQLWQNVHLYRVLIVKKLSGSRFTQYSRSDRARMINGLTLV